MITISLCMIVKNEEKNLGNCLESLKDIADEIVIVDTGSTDKTKEIALEYSAKIFDFEWNDNFSDARNFSFSKATKEYVLWLDADDIIKETDYNKFIDLKDNIKKNTDAVYMKYNTGFDENGSVNFSYYRERLLKRKNNYIWIDPVHEYLSVWGNIEYSDIAISHNKKEVVYSERNLNIYKKMIENNRTLSDRGTYYFARELRSHSYIEEATAYFYAFIQKGTGWKEDCICACLDLSYLYEEKSLHKEAINILFKSFEYDLPRSEVCCRLGTLFAKTSDYTRAIFWYKIACTLEIPATIGFIQLDYYHFIPFVELCVLYDKLGNREKAVYYHEKAKLLKPYSKAVLFNDNYFYGNLI